MDEQRAKEYEKLFSSKYIDGYCVIRLINFGKSAAVFLGKDDKNQNVAIKIFDNEISQKYGIEVQKERINNELKLINHGIDNLINIINGGSYSLNQVEYLYIVMNYIEGSNLKDYIIREGSQDQDFVKEIFKILLAVTDKLLENNIVHRDIKPANIMIDSDRNITVMDLGVIRLIKDPSITDLLGSKPFIGTLRYAPPELLMREEENSSNAWRAINLYQIGAVIHDLMMGRELFSQYTEPYPKLVKAVLDEMPDVNRIDFPHRFCQLVRNLLIKDWNSRLKVFNETTLDEILSLKVNNEFSSIVDNIKTKTQSLREKHDKISKINEKQEEKRKDRERWIADVADITDMLLNNYQKQDIFIKYNKIDEAVHKGNYNKWHRLYKIIGELRQGFAADLYLMFVLSFDIDNTIEIELFSLVSFVLMGNEKQKINNIYGEYNSAKKTISIIKGVYNKKAFTEAVENAIGKVISKAVVIMEPVASQEMEFRESIAGKPGPFSKTTIPPKNKIIDSID